MCVRETLIDGSGAWEMELSETNQSSDIGERRGLAQCGRKEHSYWLSHPLRLSRAHPADLGRQKKSPCSGSCKLQSFSL